jgi:manganese oxidase
MRLFASAVLVSAAFIVPGGPPVPASDLPVVQYNDNRVPAGRTTAGALGVELQILQARWFPLGPDKGSGDIYHFAEAGKAPSNPGPLLRVAAGTAVRVRVTNTTGETLVVHGLSGRRQAVPDTLVLAAGATGEARFTADAEGTYYYWGARPGTSIDARWYEDSQLNGALVVDPADPALRRDDRVIVIGQWVQAKTPGGDPDLDSEIFTLNGRPWPGTERFEYSVGDSVHWRFVNTTADVHPLHLHGFYFRVDARGDMARDTVYWPSQRRMAVTELVRPGETMALAFQPDRPGGWVFHCHLNWHVVSNAGIGEQRLEPKAREAELLGSHASHDPHNHVEKGMGGLMLAVNVAPPPSYRTSDVVRRQMHVFINQGSLRQGEAPPLPRFAYVLQEGATRPAVDSLQSPGSTLVLTRGEPTAIWVHNRTEQPTQVHWHGIELESYFDGVVGVGGLPPMPTPAIMPGDSFQVRITAPRAGSFMYHTHVDDIVQHSGGLWGALLVLEPGESYDAEHDLVFQVGESQAFSNILNGQSEHATRVLRSEADYRVRLMNITMGGPALEYWLVRDGAPVRWTPIAKDGFDLADYRRVRRTAQQTVSIGETYDMQVNLPAGEYALELRRGNGTVVTKVPIRVLSWQDPAVQIASAVLPLPEPLRATATVLGYRTADGPLVELRKGSNGMICLADDPKAPAFHVACYHESMEPFMARGRQLRAEGVTGTQVDTVRYREVAAGTLPMPTLPAALWQLSGPAGSYDAATNTVTGARHLYVIYVPFATTQSTGIPSIPSQDQPWLMDPGTPKAHIMFVPRM